MEISLVPTAGLCNRLNAILCAIAIHEKYNYSFDIYWEKNKDCYAQFNELFLPINIEGITVNPLKKIYLRPGNRSLLWIPNILRRFIYDKSFNGTNITNYNINDILNGYEKIYITSYNRFCLHDTLKKRLNEYFIPIKELGEKIDNITVKYSNTIGIHIRRTDNDASIRNSPLTSFYYYIDQIIKKEPTSTFYLATDDNKIKDCLILRYSNRIITNNFNLSRDTLEGMKNAIIDLYCLSKTKYILGSSWSTYSLMASNLYGKKMIIVD